jgi:hypothetical protein
MVKALHALPCAYLPASRAELLKMSLPIPGSSLQLFDELVPLGNMNR